MIYMYTNFHCIDIYKYTLLPVYIVDMQWSGQVAYHSTQPQPQHAQNVSEVYSVTQVFSSVFFSPPGQ